MTNSEKIRRKALSLGFDLCGIARCRSLERQYDRFKNWLADGCDGGLEYLRRNTGKRFDPGALCEGARSVIVCGVGYHRPPSAHEVASRIASYAHSRDYHLTIRERLNELSAYLRELVPGASGRVFTDTAPLAEKSWAVEAGLVAGESPARLVPVAGRGGYDGRIGAGRAVRARRLRNLPRLRGRLSGRGDPSRPDDRRGALHFPPDDRSRRRGRRRSARLAVRVRRMPKGLSLQPQSPGLRARLFRTACGTGTVGRRRLVGIGRGRFPADFRRNTACPVRFAPPTRADTQAEVKPDGCRDVRFFACFGTKSGLPLRLTFCLITDCIRGEKKRKLGAGECL